MCVNWCLYPNSFTVVNQEPLHHVKDTKFYKQAYNNTISTLLPILWVPINFWDSPMFSYFCASLWWEKTVRVVKRTITKKREKHPIYTVHNVFVQCTKHPLWGRASVLLSERRWFDCPGRHVQVSLGKMLNPKWILMCWSAPCMAATTISVWMYVWIIVSLLNPLKNLIS